MKRIIVAALPALLVAAAIAWSDPVPPAGLRTVQHNAELAGTGSGGDKLRFTPCGSSGQTWVWNGSTWACAAAGGGGGSGGGITNSAGANVLMKSDGANAVASSWTDTAGTSTTTGSLAVNGNTTLGDATTDAITFTAKSASTLDMNSHKILGLTNGSTSSDAAAFGQIATAVNAAVAGTTGNLASFSGANVVGNFAGSSPTACSAGQVLTRVTSAATGAITLTCTAIGTAGGTTGTGTTNAISKWTSSTALGNSSLTDNGTTVTTSEQMSISRAATASPQITLAQTGQKSWALYEAGSSDTFALWNNTASDVTRWDAVGNLTQLLALTSNGLMTGLAGLHLDTSTSDGAAPEADWIGRNGNWMIGVDVANTTPARDFVTVGRRGTYSFEDGATTSGSATLTSAAQGGFSAAIIGKAISGTGIPGGTTITAVASATSLTMSANATASATGVRVTVTDSSTYDIAYWKHRGSLAPTLGLGITPPDGSARVQVGGSDTEPTLGELAMRISSGQTANVLSVVDTGGTPRTWIDNQGVFGGNNSAWGGGFVVAGDSTNNRAVSMLDNAKSYSYGFTMPGSSESHFRYISGGVDVWKADSSGGLTALNNFVVTGTSTMNGALSMASHQIDNVTDPTSAQDAATKNYVDTRGGGGGIGMTTNSSTGTITDVSFDHSLYGGVWFTAATAVTLDGFGWTSGVPVDGDHFLLCMNGGGTLTLAHANAGETTASRRFAFAGLQGQLINSNACRDVIYDGTNSAWHLAAQNITTQSANIVLKSNGTGQTTASAITDSGTSITSTEPIGASGSLGVAPLSANYTGTLKTAGVNTIQGTNSGTFNTTSGAITVYGLNSSITASRSSGANNLTDVAMYGTASGAQVNVALQTDAGDVLLNQTSGATTISGTVNLNGGTHVLTKDGSHRPTSSNCGTGAAVVGTDESGFLTVGTSATTSCKIIFNTAYSSNVSCVPTLRSAGAHILTYSIATTGITVSDEAALSSGMVVDYVCRDH